MGPCHVSSSANEAQAQAIDVNVFLVFVAAALQEIFSSHHDLCCLTSLADDTTRSPQHSLQPCNEARPVYMCPNLALCCIKTGITRWSTGFPHPRRIQCTQCLLAWPRH